jgi:electron-transferring-flavoprotein dehydrogenase
MDVDIVCVGFGPATAGFLTTLSRQLPLPDGSLPQVICYERADDIGFGVSGVVTRARVQRCDQTRLATSLQNCLTRACVC